MPYIGMLLYVVAGFGAALVLKRVGVDTPLRYPIGALTVLPGIVIAVGMLRLIGRQDELERRVQFEAIAFAAVIVWLFTFSWGTLETLSLLPRLPAFAVATALVFAYGAGGWCFRRRYQ